MIYHRLDVVDLSTAEIAVSAAGRHTGSGEDIQSTMKP